MSNSTPTPLPENAGSRSLWRRFPAALLLGLGTWLTIAPPAESIVPKTPGHPLDDVSFSLPESYVPSDLVDGQTVRNVPELANRALGFDRFVSESGGNWRFVVDQVGGGVALVEGSGLPWMPGAGNGLDFADFGFTRPIGKVNDLPLDLIADKARTFIKRYPDLIGVPVEDLVLEEGSSGPMLDHLYYVHFRVVRGGIPVEHARVVFRINSGNLAQFGSERVSASITSAPTTPRFDSDTAWQVLWGFVGADVRDRREKPQLLLMPMAAKTASPLISPRPGEGVDYRLVWVLRFTREGSHGTWEARVDARTAELVSFLDRNDYGTIRGGTYTTEKPSAAVNKTFPMADYGASSFADLTGAFPGTVGTSTMTGRVGSAGNVGGVDIVDNCGAISLAADANGLIDFGTSGGTDCTTPGVGGAGNTHSARTQFWNVSQIKMKAYTYLNTGTPATWLQQRIVANVNINLTCNAFWNGSSINFYRSGGGCANTGELLGVSLHEWGHGMDTNDGNGTSPDRGTGETYGDVSAALQTHASCVGNTFLTSNCGGYGDACTACTGVRDIDYMKHNNTAPETVAWVQSTCPTSATYQGPCGREGHCESYPSSEAVWDLAVRDLVTWGLDATSSWQLVDEFWYASRPTATGAYACGNNTSCSAGNLFTVFRVVDDCDGNLANGTPHASAIWNAFNRHTVGCATAVNTDNNCGCPTLGASTLSGTAGNNQVSLSWTTVAGAASYDVFRNETTCASGFGKIGNTATTSFVDLLAVNGTAYNYRVQAIGSGSCPSGPVSNCATVTPIPGPEARYRTGTALQTADSRDNDGYPDNCETVTVRVTIENSGSGALTNVRITALSSSFAGVVVTTALPITIGNLAAGGTANATFQYTLGAGATKATCGQNIPFSITVAATEMSGTRVGSFSFTAEQDLATVASRTYSFETDLEGWTVAGGTFTRTNTYGGSAGTFALASSTASNNICDQVRSPVVRPSASSTLAVGTRFDIEAAGAGTYYDRANVAAFDPASNNRTLLSPTGGRTYNATTGTGPCVTAGQNGWAAAFDTWADSTGFNIASQAGNWIRLDVAYGTDPSVLGNGFRIDNIRLTNFDEITCDAQSDSCTTCTAPGAPNLSPATGTCAGVDLSWTAGTGTTLSYNVYRATTAGGPYTKLGGMPITTTTFSDTTAVAGTPYYYVVRGSCDAAGTTESGNSAERSATRLAAPTAPTGVAATTTRCTDVQVTWNAVAGATSYNVLRGTACGTVLNTFTNVTSPYNDTSAVAGTNYQYWVVAVNACGTSPNSSCAAGTRLATPAAPAAPTLTVNSCTSIGLSWTAVAGATDYEVWRRAGANCSGATQLVATTAGATTYTDATAVANTQYSYAIRAKNGCGTSASGTCATTTTTCAPILVFDSAGTATQVCGDGDSTLEPGEEWSVPVTLRNNGNQAATAAVASLAVNAGSGAPATIIAGNPGAFGAIPVGGTATASFTFRVGAAATCVTSLVFDVTGIASAEGSWPSQVPAFNRPIGSSVPGGNQTATQATTPLNASNATVNSNLTAAFTLSSADTASVTWTSGYAGGGGPTIYTDDFEAGIAGWTTTGTVANNNGDAASCGVTNNMQLTGTTGTSTASRSFTITGYTGITVIADYFEDSSLDAGELFTADWRIDGGGWTNWITGTDGGPAADTWTCDATLNVPGTGTLLEIRFTLVASAGNEDARIDNMTITGTPSGSGNWTANARVELVDPSNTATVLKDYGVAQATPYNVVALYTGPGTYRLRLSENAGGTATITGGSMNVVQNAGTNCDVAGCGVAPLPVPDGQFVAGTAMLGTKASGSNVTVDWDVTGCVATNYNVYVGAIGNFAAFGASGVGSCGVGASGNTTVSIADDSWWIVAGSDGATKVSSFGRDSSGAQSAFTGWGSGGQCATFITKDTTGTCP